MSNDLYNVQTLGGGGTSVSGALETPPPSANKSIGGSPIGQDPVDDQRVRDLIEQHLPEMTAIFNTLIENNPNPAGEVLTMFSACENILTGDVMSGVLAGTLLQCAQNFPGSPLTAHFSAGVYLAVVDPNPGTWVLQAKFYIDGAYWGMVPMSGHYVAGGEAMEFQATGDWILNADVNLCGWERPLSSQGALLTPVLQHQMFALGKHTVRIDWLWNAAFSGTATNLRVTIINQFLQFRRTSNLGCFF